jgi:hypothetical protein
MPRWNLGLIGLTLFISSGSHAATGLEIRLFDGLAVSDSLLSSIRGSGFSNPSHRLIDSGVWQELAHIRGTSRELMDNWWSDHTLSPMGSLR